MWLITVALMERCTRKFGQRQQKAVVVKDEGCSRWTRWVSAATKSKIDNRNSACDY